MQTPLRITFKGLPPSEFIETRVRDKVAKLSRFSDRITSCHVVIGSPHQHHHQGQVYGVRVEVGVPGRELVALSRAEDPSHEDVYVALRDTFSALTRQLEDYQRRQRDAARRPHAD
jgi:ribosomal subunit interface protein